jgi:hypothetical protein
LFECRHSDFPSPFGGAKLVYPSFLLFKHLLKLPEKTPRAQVENKNRGLRISLHTNTSADVREPSQLGYLRRFLATPSAVHQRTGSGSEPVAVVLLSTIHIPIGLAV